MPEEVITEQEESSVLSPRTQVEAGQIPGSLDAGPDAEPGVITAYLYGAGFCETFEKAKVADLPDPEESKLLWIDVTGVGDPILLEELGERYGLHPLALEDVVHTDQRAKVDSYKRYDYVVARMVDTKEESGTEQISIFVFDRVLISFQEYEDDPLDPVRRRIQEGRGRIRKRGVDYLAYAMLDAIIDNYLVHLAPYADELEEIEDLILDRPKSEHMERLLRVGKELLAMRRAVVPHKDMLGQLIRHSNTRFGEQASLYLRDCVDHVSQAIDQIDLYREVAKSLTDLHQSVMSNRMNEVMKVLTVISTIFIPLSFITGLYGMNFRWMPETQLRYGYFIALAIMGVIASGLILYFWRRGWFNRD